NLPRMLKMAAMRTSPLALIVLVGTAVGLHASDDTLVISRWAGRPGVGPDFADKAEKELEVGDFQAARRDVETAIQKDPTYWPAFFTRAKILVHYGKWSLALQDCNEMLRQDSTFIPAALLRSEI